MQIQMQNKVQALAFGQMVKYVLSIGHSLLYRIYHEIIIENEHRTSDIDVKPYTYSTTLQIPKIQPNQNKSNHK